MIQITAGSTFLALAAIYLVGLCLVLWLVSTLFEFFKWQFIKMQTFYRCVFWIVYLSLALISGVLVVLLEVTRNQEAVVLLVLLLTDISIAEKTSQILKHFASKAAICFRSLRQQFS